MITREGLEALRGTFAPCPDHEAVVPNCDNCWAWAGQEEYAEKVRALLASSPAEGTSEAHVCQDPNAECAACDPAPVSSGPSLDEVDPPLVEALRPMVARYGALGVKHAVDLLTDRAPVSSGEACFRHDYEHREYVCTCSPPVEGDTGRDRPAPVVTSSTEWGLRFDNGWVSQYANRPTAERMLRDASHLSRSVLVSRTVTPWTVIANAVDLDAFLAPDPCPECTQGKCGNCDGTTWDTRTDSPTACPCTGPLHHTEEKN